MIDDKSIELLRNYLYVDGKFVQQRCMPRIIKSKFPEIYEYTKDNFIENIYDLLFGVKEKPACKVCGTKVKFKNYKEGYRIFCSNKCVNVANSNSVEFSEKIAASKLKKYNAEYYTNKYDDVIEKRGENFILADGTTVNKNKHTRLKNFNINDDKQSFIQHYHSFKFNLNQEWCKEYFPNVYDEIMNYSDGVDDFTVLKYMYIHNIQSIPLCRICKKRKLSFNHTANFFNLSCGNTACKHKKSIFEINVFDFIRKNTDLEIVQNYRIEGQEIDIYIPELKWGVECNGLYWHSEIYKDKNYHLNKKKLFLDKGINIFMLWEDDWSQKKDLIKSMIKNRLKSNTTIYARKTSIKEVSKSEADHFLVNNHIQGKSTDTYRIGLYYENMLVSLMTFGKRKFITSSDHIELIRFANMSNYNVIGGFSKLLKYFIKQHQPEKIISFANLDFSDGHVYRMNGFTQKSITPPGYFWSKDGKKYHRSNFMKHKLIKMGHDKNKTEVEIMHENKFYRVFDCGNLKFELIV